MSMIFSTTKKCALCNREHSYPQLASTNAFGACDLDLRPPEMQRSTMPLWVEECSFCGYVSSNISTLPNDEAEESIVKDFVYSALFQGAEGKVFANDLAYRFYKHYMMCRKFGNNKGAFYALLHAAWACDDKDDKENAILCRKKALELVDHLITNDKDGENLSLQKADILRRSGNFDAVIEEYTGKKYSNELMNKIISFQLEKSRLKDDACYTVADI